MPLEQGSFTYPFDVAEIRADFPILSRDVYPGRPLIYLDSAATSQKPNAVIDAMSSFYAEHNANIHRGVHRLAEEATELYENARTKVMKFIGAGRTQEIIFTRNATEAINLVMQTWGRCYLNPGDLLVATEMEHHSNLVPWQILAEENGLQLELIPFAENGELDLDAWERLLDRKPKLLAFTHASNVFGTINPVRDIIRQAHAIGAVVLVDGAQAVPHMPVNVQELDADFYAFSAHKMCGPTGIGALFGKMELLNALPPFLGGGDMIKRVEFKRFEPAALPHKFEAGTPAIAEAIGFGAAVDYLNSIGMENIHDYEQELVDYAMEQLSGIPGIALLGPSSDRRGGVVAFTLEGIHPHDVAQILDSLGIAIRAGHHCAMPLHTKLGIPASSRASFYLYNTPEEVDALVEGIWEVKQKFF